MGCEEQGCALTALLPHNSHHLCSEWLPHTCSNVHCIRLVQWLLDNLDGSCSQFQHYCSLILHTPRCGRQVEVEFVIVIVVTEHGTIELYDPMAVVGIL